MARRGEIKLGDVAEDTISGFSGVVVAVTEWLNGCVRLTIQPQKMKDGKRIENDCFDVEQVALVNSAATVSARPSGGPKPTPTRNADPTR